MRRSRLTSKMVLVVLETSMYFSGIGNDSSLGEKKFDSGFNVMAVYEVSWHGPNVTSCFTGIRKRVIWCRKRPFWFSKEIYVTFSSNWTLPYRGGCSQFLISSRKFWFVHLRLEKSSTFFGKNHLFCIESFRVDFRRVHRFQLLKVCDQYVTLPNSTHVQCVSKEQSR